MLATPTLVLHWHEQGAYLTYGQDIKLKATIGKNGLISKHDKCEGDGKTPAGDYRILAGFYRPDRLTDDEIMRLKRHAGICFLPLTKEDGWCDDGNHSDYNCYIKQPFEASHEELWRDDGLYDLVFILNYNIKNPKAFAGSAIFLHCAKKIRPYDDLMPTKGCVAVLKHDLIRLFSQDPSPKTLTISSAKRPYHS